MSEDLRQWLDKVDQREQLRRINGADWSWEIGAITHMNWSSEKAPALLFDKIKDYPPGYRVVSGSLLSPSRVAMTLGLPEDKGTPELISILRKRLHQWDAGAHKFAPRKVKRGPILENVDSGKKVNIFKFPVPKWHEDDGGRFIGTGHVLITKDPDTGEVNLGTYRVQAHDATTTGLHISTAKHGWNHIKKYHDRGQAAPILLSIGHHPLVLGMGASPIEEGGEYNYLGAIMGQPFDVIEEEITGIPMPADSEIVLAGWCPPDKTHTEGPFGEFTGYYASGARPDWIVEVQRVYHRNDPILLGAPPGRGRNEHSYWTALMQAASIQNDLEKVGVVGVKGAWTHEIGGGLFLVIAIKQTYGGHSKEAGLFAMQLLSRSSVIRRYVVVVDDDIDFTDAKDVLWAICTRADPEKDIEVIRGCRSTALDPLVRKPTTSYVASHAIIDACKPWEWIDQFPKTVTLNDDMAKKVRKKWGAELGLK